MSRTIWPRSASCAHSVLTCPRSLFDTAFHRAYGELPTVSRCPNTFTRRAFGVTDFTASRTSMRLSVCANSTQWLPKVASSSPIGSGTSMCALVDGRSVESTMSFTALDGLPMGTRPGHIDPGVVLHLIAERGMTAAQVQDLLYRQCGLKGLSGISNDVRELEASTKERAGFALDYFAYHVGLNAGMLVAALGGLDAFVFTAGIGENSARMRTRIAKDSASVGRQARSGDQCGQEDVGVTQGQRTAHLRDPHKRGIDDGAAHAVADRGARARRDRQ